MDLIEKATVMAFHRGRLGGDPLDALGWRGPASQVRRFEALCRWGDMSGGTVLDLGCGYGDLKTFLDRRFADVVYLGVDFLPEFVEAASANIGQLPNTHFVQADILTAGLPEVDVVVASGSLNYRSTNALHPWRTISRMWGACRKGMAFNLLNIHRCTEDPIVVGHDPDEALAFCRQMDPDALLVEDYLPDDFTILMHKPFEIALG